jgi:transcriptional regulator with XRE-family HTH domain
MPSEYAKALGARLRAIRTQQGLSLHGVEEKSRGRWKAVVVGSYERGDRAVTVQKLAELADFYGVPVGELLPEDQLPDFDERMGALIAAYRGTLPADRRGLLDRFRCVDVAHKVVGVGSVGTRAWILLLLGRDDEDPLFLQCKEAQPSVVAPYAGASRFANQGRRVVEGQRLMQAASDIFLGWVRAVGIDGRRRDFYVRQLWDWKVSADLEDMTAGRMAAYADICAWTLARAHARSGDAIAIASYLGSGDAFDRALAAFAEAYADRNERDHHALVEAIDAGRVTAETGV